VSIHPTAIIDDGAKIGKNVSIGAYSIVRSCVVLGDGSNVGCFCEIGVGNSGKLEIGRDSIIRSHSVLYSGSVFKERLETGHRVTIREKTSAGKNLRVGTSSDIQGCVTIGDYVRMHSSVHIGKHTIIGSYVWLFPYVVTTNDPHPPSDVQHGVVLEDFSVVATMSILLPGVRVASQSIVGAHSKLSINTESGYLYSGNPAKKICKSSKVRLKDGTRRPAYPWTSHFKRGYPDDLVSAWNAQ
jgi:acyl-[acyl carrier protein]--UDP-N-acetylglucosamine O-acyltransferase